MPVGTSGEGGEDDQNNGGKQQSIDARPLVSEEAEEQLAWRFSHVSHGPILVRGKILVRLLTNHGSGKGYRGDLEGMPVS